MRDGDDRGACAVWIACGAVDPTAPVCHVCYHEAEAFARLAGKRLPTETEWEVAASWDPAHGDACDVSVGRRGRDAATRERRSALVRRRAPWRLRANLSPLGCYGMIGDVWEWTSSDFWPLSGVRDVPVPGVLRGVFRERVQGAARRIVGDASGRDPQQLPQLGLSDSAADLQRLPVRAR